MTKVLYHKGLKIIVKNLSFESKDRFIFIDLIYSLDLKLRRWRLFALHNVLFRFSSPKYLILLDIGYPYFQSRNNIFSAIMDPKL